MSSLEVDLANLSFRKDALIAEFTGRAPVWHAAQAAALAVAVLALVSGVSRTLDLAAIPGVLVLSVAGWVLAGAQLGREERRFHAKLAEVLGHLEKLKTRGGD